MTADARALIAEYHDPKMYGDALEKWIRKNLGTVVTCLAGALDKVDRINLPRECPVRQCCETHDVPAEIAKLRTEIGEAKLVIEQQDRDLERMRAGLRESIGYIDPSYCDDGTTTSTRERLSKLLPSTGEPCTTTK